MLTRNISIHAPRAGCDCLLCLARDVVDISIHAPRAGCDTRHGSVEKSTPLFQSTHPVRGATSGLTSSVL